MTIETDDIIYYIVSEKYNILVLGDLEGDIDWKRLLELVHEMEETIIEEINNERITNSEEDINISETRKDLCNKGDNS